MHIRIYFPPCASFSIWTILCVVLLVAILSRKTLLVRHLRKLDVETDIISMVVLTYTYIIYRRVYWGVLDSDFYETTTAVVKYAEVRIENEEGEDEDVQLRICWDRI